VVPGVHYRRWDEFDARGPVRVHLLRVNLRRPGLRLEYAAPERVASTDKLTRILRQDDAVAGVNGDFFDMGDTGAPLGVGVDGGQVAHGPREHWVASLRVGDAGVPVVGRTPVRVRVTRGPELPVAGVNSPHVPVHGIGLYTARWGTNPGYTVTEGARRRDVRQVVVRGGRVVSNQRAVDRGSAIRGHLLVGRGDGARMLARRWRVGTRVGLRLGAAQAPKVAIGGSQQLLGGGELLVTDDRQLHPRTAVGWDRDSRRLLLVVVDGRQQHSRGLTLLELAELLQGLGAEDALNLDGGGSSTMVARRPTGRVRVVSSPSGGVQRAVPNGLQLLYAAPQASAMVSRSTQAGSSSRSP
jgi:hypothetical protein